MKPRTLPSERRQSLRFPIPMELCYRAGSLAGFGRTLDWSAKGVLCSLDQPISLGAAVELVAAWPAKLHGEVPLNLSVFGSVVRIEANGVVVRIEKYEFRTRPQKRTMLKAA